MIDFIQPQEQDIRQQQEGQPQQEPHRENLWEQKDYLEFVKHYAEDDVIPEDVKKSKWGVFGKALTYTFLDDKDLPTIDMFSTILRIDTLITQPAHRITFDEVQKLDQTQLYMYLTAKRAIGTEREKLNERTLQNTQIAQNISTNTQRQHKPQGGFFSRIKAAF